MKYRHFIAAVMAFVCVSFTLRSELNIVPQPRIATEQTGHTSLSATPRVYIDPELGISYEYVASRFAEKGLKAIPVTAKSKAAISLTLNPSATGHKEGYTLRSAKGKMTAEASDRNGALYALETISQLISENKGKYAVPACTITDWPELGWRDYMLDESRHFHGKDFVKSMLDEMARLKMNTFHWHLVDDPGWRIEIDAYPRLTSVSSWGDYSKWDRTEEEWRETYPEKERGYYTKSDIREIVAYAAERGIRVIPEIEIPGHCHAALTAYPELGATCDDGSSAGWDIFDVTKPEYDRFIKAVLDEVTELFPSRIVHIGGDEANYTRWQKNTTINEFMKQHGLKSYSDLQLLAVNRAAEYLASKGVAIIGWNEITGDNVHDDKNFTEPSVQLKPGTIVQFWDGSPEFARKAIEKGYDLVNSDRFYTYLDYSYETTPLEKAYSFNPVFEGLTPEQRAHVIGTGCQMWGEFTPTVARVYYQTFPRIAACAESGWTPAENKDLDSFRRRIAPTEQQWKQKGYITDQPTYSSVK